MRTPFALAREREVLSVPLAGEVRGLLAVALLVVALFHRVLFKGEAFFERDINCWWRGQVEVFVRAVSSGAWPVWDPYMGFGQPMLANPSTQILYPWTWLNLILSPETSYIFYVVSHWLVSGAGMYTLARHVGVCRRGAVLASGVWLLSGPFLSMVSLWHHQAGAALLPWVFWAADRLLAGPSFRRGLVFSALFALQILAGSSEMCAMSACAVAADAARHIFLERSPTASGRRRLTALMLAGSLAVGLSAAQWLPAVEYAISGSRLDLWEGARTFWSVQPVLLAQSLVPVLVHRLPLALDVRQLLYDGREPFLSSLYLGLCALPLVWSALIRPRPEHRRLAWLAAGLLVGSAMIALGRHFVAYGALSAVFPPARMFRYPVKATILMAFAWALLTGIGWTAWEAGKRRRLWRGWVIGSMGVLAGIVLFAAALAWMPQEEWVRSKLQSPPGSDSSLRPLAARLLFTGALAALSSALLVLRPAWLESARGRLSLAGLVLLDLYVAHAGLSPTVARGTFDRPSPVVDALRGRPLPRLFVFDYGKIRGKTYRRRPPAPQGPRFEDPFQQARVAHSYSRAPLARAWGVSGSYELELLGLGPSYLNALDLFMRGTEETPGFLRLLQLASVHAVLARHSEGLEDFVPLATFGDELPDPIRVFGVPDPLPRAYAVGASRVEEGLRAYETLVDAGFDPRREVVLSEGTPLKASSAFRARTWLRTYEADRVGLEVELNGPGYVVVSDAFDPRWRAAVDGRPAPLLRANVAFRAVPIEAGRHVVEMVYRPRSVSLGLVTTLVSVLGTGIVCLARSHHARATRQQPAARQHHDDGSGAAAGI